MACVVAIFVGVGFQKLDLKMASVICAEVSLLKWYNWALITVMILSLVMQAQAFCGDGVCDGRSSWIDPDSGLGSENWDNCALDCARVFNERPTWVTYHSNEEIDAIMDDLVKDHPGRIRMEVVGSSLEGRPIKIYVLGSGKGGFFFDGRLHGVEDCGTESGLQFFRWVLMSKMPEAADLRANGSIIFMPVANPDSSGRQNNRRLYPDGTQVPYGVDLNRNFVKGWGSEGSTDPKDQYDYMGQSPASEPETQALIKVLDVYDPRVYFNVHCGMALASGGGNTSISSAMMKIMRSESDRLENGLFDVINPYYSSSCGVGGYAKAQACDQNTSSWLIEVASWDQVPATLESYNDKYWHNLWPLYYSAALVALDSPPLISDPLPLELPSDPLDAPMDLDQSLGKFSEVSQEALTEGSDRDILILNVVLPIREIAPWLGLILFLGFIGVTIVGFSNVGGMGR